MKKVSLVLALGLVVTFAMAQKTTWITQSGNGNLADVTQILGSDAAPNSIYATQSGDLNTLNTEQRGVTNYIELVQSGDENTANMDQFTSATGITNTAVVVQSGAWNKANLTQKEDPLVGLDNSKNKATATQSGTQNSYVLKQGGEEWGTTNEQYLNQSGASNKADVSQIGYTDYSEINQSANWNKAKLNQTAGQGGVGTATSNSWQTAASNMLDILQQYDSGKLQANSVQNGAGNTTNIEQQSNNILNVVSQQLGSDIINVKQIGF